MTSRVFWMCLFLVTKIKTFKLNYWTYKIIDSWHSHLFQPQDCPLDHHGNARYLLCAATKENLKVTYAKVFTSGAYTKSVALSIYGHYKFIFSYILIDIFQSYCFELISKYLRKMECKYIISTKINSSSISWQISA